jgi:uncharacterized oligopeptide transporter (OPT) family protein
VAIGLYLPIQLTVSIFIGGLIRGLLEGEERVDTFERKIKVDSGILYASGLIAGEGVIGVLLAILSVVGVKSSLNFNFGILGTLIAFVSVILLLMKASVFKKVYEEEI